MNLTSKLEELIWCGKARYETWTVGTAAAGLSVKDNEAVVIIGFEYFDFIDPVNSTSSAINNFFARLNKQITFSSPAKSYNFLHRSRIRVDRDPELIDYVIANGGQASYDCYMPFEDNVSINIANIPGADTWTSKVFAAAPAKSKQRPTPLGYGTVNTRNLPTMQSAFTTPDAQFRAFKDTPEGASAAGGQSFAAFNVPFSAETLINPPIGAQWATFTHPLVTVHLVRINERLSGRFV